MEKFLFETSLGTVKCIIDTDKPSLSSDPYHPKIILSEGEITVIEGKTYLDKLYTWVGLRLINGWVKVDFDDGYYGCPEYRRVDTPIV